MKKLYLLIILLLMPTWAWGANWFAGAGDTDFNAVSGGTTSSVWNANADGTSGAYLDWASQPANGDVFIANGATLAIDDSIGSESVTVTLTTEGTAYGGTDGGGFTMAIDTNNNKTLYVNIGKSTPEGTTDILSLTDAADATNGVLTIVGNVYGGAGSSVDGIADGRADTDSLLTIIGNITGGSTTNAIGLNASGNGSNSNITGNLTGGSSNSAPAVYCGTNAVVSITGNLIASATTEPVRGKFRWTPNAPANGVTGHYFKADGGGTAIYVGKNTDDVTKAKTDFYYIDPTDGGSDQGTAAGSGGGAWSF